MDHRIHTTGVHPSHVNKPSQQPVKINTATFDGLLQKELQQKTELKVSKHAQQRLTERNISIDSNVWKTIESKINEAKQKGIKDSLVVTNDAALVVSTANQTVITAMNRKEASSHIFTNINGTILID